MHLNTEVIRLRSSSHLHAGPIVYCACALQCTSTPHYTTTAAHYATLHYITLHYITLHYITLQNETFC